jgi:hypothetical protein
MTKKHFKELAAIVRLYSQTQYHYQIFNDLADFCKNHNTRFDRDKFRFECGIG